jgi:hypothetical protein
MRPILLNGIPDVVGRPDLGDRALAVTLAAIEEDQRLTEAELWRRFDAAAPGIFGALLDAVSSALRNIDKVKLSRQPRMADFALWIEAASPGLGWEPGSFAAIYEANRAHSAATQFEASTLAQVVRNFVLTRPDPDQGWTGTAMDLLAVLGDEAGEQLRRSRHWPETAAALGSQLRRLAPVLAAAGVEMDARRAGKNRQRILHLRRAPGAAPAS